MHGVLYCRSFFNPNRRIAHAQYDNRFLPHSPDVGGQVSSDVRMRCSPTMKFLGHVFDALRYSAARSVIQLFVF